MLRLRSCWTKKSQIAEPSPICCHFSSRSGTNYVSWMASHRSARDWDGRTSRRIRRIFLSLLWCIGCSYKLWSRRRTVLIVTHDSNWIKAGLVQLPCWLWWWGLDGRLNGHNWHLLAALSWIPQLSFTVPRRSDKFIIPWDSATPPDDDTLKL